MIKKKVERERNTYISLIIKFIKEIYFIYYLLYLHFTTIFAEQ